MDNQKFCVKRKKTYKSTKEELQNLDKEELVERVLRLESHNLQLKNIIDKSRLSESQAEDNKGRFNFLNCHTRRILLRVMYLGWDYNGLATQEDTTKTIEYELFSALMKTKLVESREKAGYHRCGRTDKGVSSFGQVISLTVRSKFSTEKQNELENMTQELQYCKMLNRLLPTEIRALCWQPIPQDKPEFSARFDCTQRDYHYYFPQGSLDVSAMSAACRHLVGTHDMRNLCKMDVANGITSFVRTIRSCYIQAVDKAVSESAQSMYCLHISADSFLWHQIRCIVGILLLVGQDLEHPDVVKELLDVEKNPRKPQYSMGLDLPLNLWHCQYDVAEWRWDKDELATVIARLQTEWTKHSIKKTMIVDCLRSLERQLESLYAEGDETGRSVRRHADCLLEGVRPRVHRPLMQREKCSSLEDRIEHYTKKQRIEPVATSDM